MAVRPAQGSSDMTDTTISTFAYAIVVAAALGLIAGLAGVGSDQELPTEALAEGQAHAASPEADGS